MSPDASHNAQHEQRRGTEPDQGGPAAVPEKILQHGKQSFTDNLLAIQAGSKPLTGRIPKNGHQPGRTEFRQQALNRKTQNASNRGALPAPVPKSLRPTTSPARPGQWPRQASWSSRLALTSGWRLRQAGLHEKVIAAPRSWAFGLCAGAAARVHHGPCRRTAAGQCTGLWRDTA